MGPSLVLCELRKSINNFNHFPKDIITTIPIQNSYHTHEHIYLRGKPFCPWNEKPQDKLQINSTIIKLITISLKFMSNLRSTPNAIINHLVYVSQLKKSPCFLCFHTHSLLSLQFFLLFLQVALFWLLSFFSFHATILRCVSFLLFSLCNIKQSLTNSP